ncbi:MAG: helix-turn-helix domain-containing protein [Vicinamibacterales bacterium]
MLDREVRRVLVSSCPGIDARVTQREDSTRWHALGARCRQARGARGIRDVAVALGIPEYRLRAVEGGLLKEVRVDLARRYFRFLGIDEWVATWCRANRELATRIGLLDGSRTRPRHRP